MRAQLFLTLLALLIFVFLILATSSGRWTKSEELSSPWREIGLWENCSCIDLKDQPTSCQTKSAYLNTVEAFSLIEVGAEFVGIFLLFTENSLFKGNRIVYFVALACYIGALLANIITWTTFSGFYKKENMCASGEQSLEHAGYNLSWGYALRLVELAGLGVITGLIAIGFGRGKEERTGLHKFTLMFTLVVLLLGIITTAARGWLLNRSTGNSKTAQFGGLWDLCVCNQNFDDPCHKQTQRFQGAEAFSVISIVVEFVIVYLLYAGYETKKHLNIIRVLTTLNFAAMLITLALFVEVVSSVACLEDPALDSQNYHWGFAIQCIAFICQFLLLGSLWCVRTTTKKISEPQA